MSPKRKTTVKRKPRGKPFVKGDPRANLAGRPPVTLEEREFKELCKTKAPAAVERLEKLALGKGTTAYKANEYLIDRGYGKPKQETEVKWSPGTRTGLMIMLPPVEPVEE
jgi:hypothetical protein